MNKEIVNSNKLRRRDFLKDLALSASVLASAGTCGCRIAGISRAKSQAGPATQSLSLDRDWLFGGKFNEAAMQRSFSDTGFQSVTLPHCVAKLSWQNWDPASWEDRWVYRRHFDLPPQFRNRRLFLHFDGVTVGAAPIINGHTLTQHLGGYLPFHYEITSF